MQLFCPSSGALDCELQLVVQCIHDVAGHWPATSWVHCTTSCKHSLVLLRMGEIIVRNLLSWFELLINRFVASSWLFTLLLLLLNLQIINLNTASQSIAPSMEKVTFYLILVSRELDRLTVFQIAKNSTFFTAGTFRTSTDSYPYPS